MKGAKENLIYDVGMHRGEDTEFYLKKGFNVIGFEADPQLVEHCNIRFKDAIATGRLHIAKGAIAPANVGDTVTFFRNPGSSVWGTIDPRWADRNAKLGYNSESITVRRIDMFEAYKSFGIPHYIKIDIEGMDRLALEVLTQFGTRPTYVSLESDKVDFSALQSELCLLRELGYRKFKVVQQASIPGSAIVAKSLDGREFELVFERDASGPFGDDIPQPWLTFDDAIRKYEIIFRRYRLFGDTSQLVKVPGGVRAIGGLYKLGTGYRGPLPGWFDTHASL